MLVGELLNNVEVSVKCGGVMPTLHFSSFLLQTGKWAANLLQIFSFERTGYTVGLHGLRTLYRPTRGPEPQVDTPPLQEGGTPKEATRPFGKN